MIRELLGYFVFWVMIADALLFIWDRERSRKPAVPRVTQVYGLEPVNRRIADLTLRQL